MQATGTRPPLATRWSSESCLETLRKCRKARTPFFASAIQSAPAHPRTPHIDAMVANGTRLSNFYVAAPICSSSRASLLTGRVPLRNGIWSNASTHLITFGVDAGGGLPTSEVGL